MRWPWDHPAEWILEDLKRRDPKDPRYVSEEQLELSLVPHRRHPPAKRPFSKGGNLLPTDDTIWKEELESDSEFRSKYFVTNLEGGTLVINGLEVKKGQIAGPLPEFAIIETPGNQFSFWFGPGGRNWRGGDDEGPDYVTQWKTLRRRQGWEHVGLSAGQVWDLKIREQVRREYKGEERDDDTKWTEWKAAEATEDGEQTLLE